MVFLGVAIRIILTIGSTAILARLLKPSEFGEMSIAVAVTELTSLLGNFGLHSILIQKRRICRLDLDTMFWAGLGMGIFLAAIVVFFSLFIGRFFNNDNIGSILRYASSYFVFEGLRTVHSSIIYRLMLFKLDFYIQTAAIIVRNAAAIFFAWKGLGVLSLVFSPIASHIFITAASLITIQYTPRARFNIRFLIKHTRTSVSYLGSGLLFYCNMNFDIILLGKLLDVTALGYYQSCRSLTDELRARITTPLQKVLFPAFSALQSDQPRFQKAVIRSTALLSLVVSPIGVGMAALSPEIVLILFGKNWEPMIGILPYIAIAGTLRATLAVASTIYNATNRMDASLKVNSINTVLFFIFISIGSHWGIIGFAQGNLASAVAFSLVAIGGYRIIGLTPVHLLASLFPTYFASTLMFGIITITRTTIWPAAEPFHIFEYSIPALTYVEHYVTPFRDNSSKDVFSGLSSLSLNLSKHQSPQLRLIILLIVGMVSYFVFLLILSRPLLLDAWRVTRKFINRSN